MKHATPRILAGFAVAALLLCPLAASAADVAMIASVQASANAVSFVPQQNNSGMMLRVATPSGLVYEQEFEAGANPSVLLAELGSADGSYTWELVLYPVISNSVRAQLLKARAAGDERLIAEMRARGDLPAAMRQYGTFTVYGGAIAQDDLAESEEAYAAQQGDGLQAAGEAASGGLVSQAEATQVIAMDLIVQGSECVGMDCTSSESFGFDTIRLKENNLRIKFDDTSSTGSFPFVDWQLTANDSANGGANKFSIDDITNSRTPFTIEANAPTNSLFVDDGGRVGLGTATPVVELQIVEGDSPTLRLEQDGSSGFTPQTWDVAGNETNFFVRDVTGGSRLPFKIKPTAPTNSLVIDTDGDVGIGILAATEALQVNGSDGGTKILVTETSATDENRVMLQLSNATGNVQTSFIADAGGTATEWRQTFRDVDLIFDSQEDGTNELELDIAGNLVISGMLTQNSDVRNKKDIEEVDVHEVLDKLAQLSISKWTYKQDVGPVRHLGPMAQDFHAAFGLGKTPNGIGAVDADGVALASIQALYQKLQEKDEVLKALQAQNEDLARRLEALEQQTP